ncbi:hypothetical protein BH11BAC7_BH11BAC7_16280 [soil metagenome]
MDLIIKNITSKKDVKFLSELAKRLGLTSVPLSLEEKEDIALGYAINESRKSGYVAEKEMMKLFKKPKGK